MPCINHVVADITGVRDLDNENIRNPSDYFFLATCNTLQYSS